jgi:hypothetical protein
MRDRRYPASRFAHAGYTLAELKRVKADRSEPQLRPKFGSKLDWFYRLIIQAGCIGALGEIRTPDPRIRSPMLYPAELRALSLRTLARQNRKASPGIAVAEDFYRGFFNALGAFWNCHLPREPAVR